MLILFQYTREYESRHWSDENRKSLWRLVLLRTISCLTDGACIFFERGNSI